MGSTRSVVQSLPMVADGTKPEFAGLPVRTSTSSTIRLLAELDEKAARKGDAQSVSARSAHVEIVWCNGWCAGTSNRPDSSKPCCVPATSRPPTGRSASSAVVRASSLKPWLDIARLRRRRRSARREREGIRSTWSMPGHAAASARIGRQCHLKGAFVSGSDGLWPGDHFHAVAIRSAGWPWASCWSASPPPSGGEYCSGTAQSCFRCRRARRMHAPASP